VGEIAVLVLIAYFVTLFVISRRPRSDVLPAPDDLFTVFTIPCLNEERVISGTLESLLALQGDDYAIVVVDDGSDDSTAALVQIYESEGVHLVRRQLPDARRGKGAALNAAFRYLVDSELLATRSPENVVMAVFDADGRIEREALSAMAGYFRDPNAGAVQLQVEMRNADANLLTRLQDMEFVVFTEIFQRARQRLGSVGLGGNGQFVRLSALQSLGAEPWSDCLTEDLDLGVRLLLKGWTNSYCPTAAVSQQAVTSLRGWVRQRARWFHGHLQCWRLMPRILRSRLAGTLVSDLLWYLLLPCWVLLIPLIGLPVLVGFVVFCLESPRQAAAFLSADHGLVVFVLYLLMFGPAAYISGPVYWMRGRVGLLKAVVLGHAFELYANFWLIAGWMAVFRLLRRKGGWAKTARVAEVSSRPAPASAGAPR
jgi:1,2-diacylglycerol 3-beta-glucosyltransferase